MPEMAVVESGSSAVENCKIIEDEKVSEIIEGKKGDEQFEEVVNGDAEDVVMMEGGNAKMAEAEVVKDEKKEGATKKDAASVERPVRERKLVKRLVEVIEKEPNQGVVIRKGLGTPLKDIPNVAYKLARKKCADLKLLHQMLFGRKGKAVDFKNHILQFSGFVWQENDEKEKHKMKEKLDKCVKDTLVDLCDLFDIHVSRTTTRKEDLVVKLLDFMASPHATTDVILADKEQESSKSRKRKMVASRSTPKSRKDTQVQTSRKRSNTGGTPKMKAKSADETDDEEEEEEEENENGVPHEEEALKDSNNGVNENESEEAGEEADYENESEEAGEEAEDYDGDSKKDKQSSAKYLKQSGSMKSSPPTTVKKPSRSSSSKRQAVKSNTIGPKDFSRKKKTVESHPKKSTPKSDKEKASGKKPSKSRGKSESKQSGPTKDELRITICEILKDIDFNTATFSDILKQLGSHYKMDMMPRKVAIKLMIQEELAKLADEAEENEAGEDEDAEKDAEY